MLALWSAFLSPTMPMRPTSGQSHLIQKAQRFVELLGDYHRCLVVLLICGQLGDQSLSIDLVGPIQQLDQRRGRTLHILKRIRSRIPVVIYAAVGEAGPVNGFLFRGRQGCLDATHARVRVGSVKTLPRSSGGDPTIDRSRTSQASNAERFSA